MGCFRDNRVKPVEEEDNSWGPLSRRGCTDVWCLLLFTGCLAGMGYTGYKGVELGDPYRLLFGVDTWGNTCNRDNRPVPGATHSGRNLIGKTKLFYFNYGAILDPGTTSDALCITKCPNITILTYDDMRNLAVSGGPALCRYDVSPNDYGPSANCPALPVTPQMNVLNRCVSTSVTDTAQNLAKLLPSKCPQGDFIQRISNDVETAWKETVYMCAISFGIALVLTLLFRFFAAPVIWILVIGCGLGSVAATATCWWTWYEYHTKYTEVPTGTSDQKDAELVRNWLIISCVVSSVTVMLLLVLLVMRKRVMLVVQLFREAGAAVSKIPAILFQPFWTMLVLTVFLAGLGFVFLYVESAGEPTVDSNDRVRYIPDQVMFYLKWFYLFGVLWVVQFVLACQQLLVAGAVASWYFCRDKKNIGWPLATSFKRLVRYHLGSVAFGALLITLVQLARAVLSYIQHKLDNKTGRVVKFCLKCLQCCLWCFEKVLKYINKNAYIMIAIYGCNMCTGARRAFTLLMNNILRVGAINSVGTFCLFLGKAAVVAIVAVVGMKMFKFDEKEDLCYSWAPVVLGCVFAFIISHSFLSIYGMTIDTVFLCFCEDCERNDGIENPYFMSRGLMIFVENSRQAIAAHDARELKKRMNLRPTKPGPLQQK